MILNFRIQNNPGKVILIMIVARREYDIDPVTGGISENIFR